MIKPSARSIVAWAIAGALLLAGAATILVGVMTPVSFGWFAYQPRADATFAPQGEAVFLSTAIIGLTAFTLGLLVLAFPAGWHLAKRQAS
jgi:hypothetical protein